MAVSKRLRSAAVTGGGTPKALVTGVSRALNPFGANMGAGDVRGRSRLVQTITLNSFGGTDSFKIRVNSKSVAGGVTATDTVAFVRGTNATAAAIQSALRTATGDASLTVSGSTDAGPFTVTFVARTGQKQPVFQLVTLDGCSGNVARTALTYGDAEGKGSFPTDNGIRFDQESSVGRGDTFPLGYSAKSDGTGQTAGTTLAAPTMVSAVGGSGSVTIDTTEVASGGTSAVVLFAVVDVLTGATVANFTEDADGDVVISSLAAGNYFLLGHTQTANGRVGPSFEPEYFTVT